MVNYRDQMEQEPLIWHFSPCAQQCYLGRIKAFVHHSIRRPNHLTPDDIHTYHRVALSNSQLLETNDGQVTFRYNDRADGNKTKVLTLDAGNFHRRFLLHILPKGSMWIRRYGLLANRSRGTLLESCRQLLIVPSQPPRSLAQDLPCSASTTDRKGKGLHPLSPLRPRPHRLLKPLLPQPARRWPTFNAKIRGS